MKVLHVTPNFLPRLGGVESYVVEILLHMHDIESIVLTNWRRGTYGLAARFPGVDFAYGWPRESELRRWFSWSTPTLRGYRLIESSFELLRSMNRVGWLRRLEADVIHVHYHQLDQTDRIARRVGLGRLIKYWYRWFASSANEMAPIVFTDHTVFTAPSVIVPSEAKAALLENYRNIVSVDRESHEIVRSHQAERGGKSWFIPNSVDTKQFHESYEPHDKIRVGYAGRMGKEGESLLTRIILGTGDRVEWRLALADPVRTHARSGLAGTPGNVKQFFNLDYEEMPTFYRSVDLLFNPFPGPGVGRTTLEAMASGVPVIAVGMGDKYPIRNGITGMLLRPEPEAIVHQILELADRPDWLRDMGRASREVAVREYSNDVLLPKLRAVYAELAQ